MDLGCFLNIKVIRDHTKRKVFAGHETERYDLNQKSSCTNTLECFEQHRILSELILTHGYCRQALRYVIRNMSLPSRTRAEAQLKLTQMHCYSRPTQIRNRCILGGKGRGILRDFKMSRVCALLLAIVGIVLREVDDGRNRNSNTGGLARARLIQDLTVQFQSQRPRRKPPRC